jgi:tetratricopeptide (TPR) repeat protein
MSHWYKKLVLGVTGGCGLLAGILWLAPSERQQWTLAVAHEARLNGDYQRAIDCLSHLIEIDPTDLAVQLQRVATWIEADKRAVALQALNSILESDDLPMEQSVEASRLLGLLQQHQRAYNQLELAHRQLQERLRQPLQADTRPRELSAQERLLWANNLGYYAYLADADLPQRLAELNDTLSQNSVEEQVALYRSQALRVVGRSGEGREIVTIAAERLAERLVEEEADLQAWVGSWMMTPDWPTPAEPAAIGHKRSSVMEMRLMLRILWEQAATLSQDLGEAPPRREFLARAVATRISRDHVQFDMSPQIVAQQLVMFATYLDTRGALATKLEKWSQATADLDAAIQANYLAEALTADFGMQNTPMMVDVRQLRQLENHARRALAIYHHHRGLLRAARGEVEAARRDWQAIQRLGFQPGPELN